MKNYIHKNKYFYGNEISEYGLENGYIDYRTLAQSFNMILNNDIMANTASIGWWEQVNGFVDNSDEIEELTEKKEEIEDILCDMIKNDEETTEEYKTLEKKYNNLEADIQELKEEEDYPPEIFQCYIVSENGAKILQEYTEEIVFYNDVLDMFVWGVCHYGTAWDHVLTNIPVTVKKEG